MFTIARIQKRKKEVINKTKVSGVGLTDGSVVSQLIGSTFQRYNFYNNWLNILQKDFVSPIADSWKLYYEYFLADSVSNGTGYDYHIEFEPRAEAGSRIHRVVLDRWTTHLH